jgi:hypothetical protein
MSIARSAWMLVVGISLAVVVGCSRTSAPDAADGDSGSPAMSIPGQDAAAFDQGKGYLHKPSGVGFVYPAGWEMLGVKSQGPETSLGLRKNQGDVEVTLSWAEVNASTDEYALALSEYDGLRALYKDNVHRPEPITQGARRGYRVAVVGAPLGVMDPEAFGVVYLFVARRGQQAWTIKLRATARGPQNLARVEELLGQYRW